METVTGERDAVVVPAPSPPAELDGTTVPIRRRTAEPPEPEHNPLAVTAPADDEVYAYLGPQMRWVQLFLITAFALAGWSLLIFATGHPWFWPALIVLAANVIGTTFATITGVSKRQITWASHQALVSDWSPTAGHPSVDIFLPTCGEGLDILNNTYRYVSELAWPGEVTVYVLDDAARESVAALAADYRFRYVVRPDRGHLRKAGNLRHAHSISGGEFIVIFDADFCPRHDFLQISCPISTIPRWRSCRAPSASPPPRR